MNTKHVKCGQFLNLHLPGRGGFRVVKRKEMTREMRFSVYERKVSKIEKVNWLL